MWSVLFSSELQIRSPHHNVSVLLQQMEDLQNKRTINWLYMSEKLTNERLELGRILLSRLDQIERDTGVFLIKPYVTLASKKYKLEIFCVLSNLVFTESFLQHRTFSSNVFWIILQKCCRINTPFFEISKEHELIQITIAADLVNTFFLISNITKKIQVIV